MIKQTLPWLFLAAVWGAEMSCASSDAADESSPTGTYLDPRDGLGESGYNVLDEVCDNTDDFDYMNRFATPMFREAVVVGDVVYLVDGSLLWAISIEDTTSPKRLSLTRLLGTPISIASMGEFLAVANGKNELMIVDIADPTSPTVAATLTDLPGISLGVAAAKNRIFIAGGEAGLVIADASDSRNPVVESVTSLVGFANAVAVEGDFAYVSACSDISIVDISTNGEPIVKKTLPVPEGHARKIATSRGNVAVAAGEALFLYDARDPDLASLTNFYNDPYADGFYVNAVALKDDIAYIAAGDESFRAVDIFRAAPMAEYVSPSEIDVDLDVPMESKPPGTLTIYPTDPIGIGVKDNYLLVLGNFRYVGERLLRIMDISNPYKIVELGQYAQPKDAVGATASNDLVYIHHQNGITDIWDASQNPVGAFETEAAVVRMETLNDTAYFLLENGEVSRTFDFETFTKVSTGANDMAVVTLGEDGETTAVIADAAANALTVGAASLSLGDAFLGFSRLFAEKDRVYAYDWTNGELYTVGISESGTLSFGGSLYLGPCEAYDVADYYSGRDTDRVRMQSTKEGFALLCPKDASGMPSIVFIGLDNPDRPTELERWDLPVGRYADFQAEGDVFYTVGFDNNVYRSFVDRFFEGSRTGAEFDGAASGIAVLGNEIFVADNDNTIARFRFENDELVGVDTTTGNAGGLP